MKYLAFALAAAAMFGAVASAREIVTAKLAAPLESPRKVIAGSVVWICEADTCTAAFDRSVPARTCGQIAREVGTLVSFGPEGAPIPAEALARCNARARAR